MLPRALLLAVLGAAPARFAAPLSASTDAPSFSFVPPPGFELDRSAPVGESDAAAPALDPQATRRIEAVFTDPADGAQLMVARVGAPLEASEETKDALAVALAPHYHRVAGADFSFSWADPPARTGRIEMAGTLAWPDGKRDVHLAWIPAGGHHFVVTLSAPPPALPRLEPALKASLDTFLAPPSPGPQPPWSIAALGLAAALLGVVALRLSRALRPPPPAPLGGRPPA